MRQILIITMVSLGFALEACQTDFFLGEPTSEELCLICFPGQRDTTIIQLYKTVPIGGWYDGSPYLKSADIVFTVDGERQVVEYAEEPVGSVPKGCWFFVCAITSGQQVEVKASVENVPAICAKTTIPFPSPAFEYKWISSGIEVSFVDDASSNDYYGLAVVCEQTLEKDGKKRITVHNMPPYSEGYGTHEIAVVRDYYDTGFTGWSLWPKWTGYYGVRVWKDSAFNGAQVKLAMAVNPANFGSGYDAEYDPEMEGAAESFRYKVCLYSFSEEFFKYMSALDYQFLNDYATYGIVPMMPSYTNITAGCGILAGWTMSESEWMEIDDN